jgi:WG containing repeat
MGGVGRTFDLRGAKSGFYIDKLGRVVIKPRFQFADSFENGIAHVEVGDRDGYLDKTGKYVWHLTQ